MRELSYSSLRLGLYDPVKSFLAPNVKGYHSHLHLTTKTKRTLAYGKKFLQVAFLEV